MATYTKLSEVPPEKIMRREQDKLFGGRTVVITLGAEQAFNGETGEELLFDGFEWVPVDWIVSKKSETATDELPKDEVVKQQILEAKKLQEPLTVEKEKELREKFELTGNKDLDDFRLSRLESRIDDKRIELEAERKVNLDAGRVGVDSEKFRTLQKEYYELIQFKKKRDTQTFNAEQKQNAEKEKLTKQNQQKAAENIESSKKTEEKRLAKKEETRKSAIQSGTPLPPPPPPPPTDTGVAPQETQDEKCPCGSKLTEGEKSTINWGRSNSVFQNPMASQINNAQGGFADTLGKINRINGVLGALGGSTDQLTTLTNRIGNMQGILSNYANESNRLSGLPFTGNGPDLLSLVSTVGAAVNFQCALGIEGLDVGLGIGLMTENGKLKLNSAISVNADISKLLDGLDLGSGSSGGIMEGINNIGSEINNVTNKLNEVAGEINGAIDQVNGMYNDALDFVSQFTSINFAMDFAIDECTKFGVGFQQGILNPEFIQRARAANPLNNAANPGFGSSFR